MSNILKSKKTGVLFSYIFVACNTLSSFILVPIYLKYLGVDGYGFYQMIYAVASYILILDFGIGTTMTRFLTEYKTKNDKIGAENFAAHCLAFISVISVLIIIIGVILSFFLGDIYPTLTADKVLIGQKMFYFMIAVLVLTVFEHYFEGVAIANDSYSIAKLIGVIKLLFKFTLVLLFLSNGDGVTGLAYTDVVVETISILLYSLLCFGFIKFKIKWHRFDKKILIAMSTFAFAILLQSIVSYINSTADKTILGIMIGEEASGLYGISMTLITAFNMLPTSILTLFLPQATKMVVEGTPMEKHDELAARIGRYQLIVCGGFISAFTVIGKDFIALWTGESPDTIWQITMIVIIPSAIPLIQNYCLNVLDALNKRMFRSLVLLGIFANNVILTVLMIKWMGILGAPIATGISYILGHWIIMNVYLHKKIGMNILKMWKNIFHRLLICILIVTAATYPLALIKCDNWLMLILKAIVWCVVFFGSIFLFGMNSNEKNMIKSLTNRLLKK